LAIPTDPRPFSERLDELRRRDGVSFRALEDRLRRVATPEDRPVSHSHLVRLASGKSRPTPEVIAIVARAFPPLEPESFVEWRLWQAQNLFDPDRSEGLDAAIEALRTLELWHKDSPAALQSPTSRESRRHARAIARTAAHTP
jgi:transcriptional regulator with XRE-family HTH domain